MSDNKYLAPGKYFSWEIIDQVTAIKHADMTFVENCETGVPKQILSFFDAENLGYGQKKELLVINNNKKYRANVMLLKNLRTKLSIDKSFSEVIERFYTKGDDYPAFLFQWCQEGTYLIDAIHTFEISVPKDSYLVDVAYNEIDNSNIFKSKEEVLNKCFGQNVKKVNTDIFNIDNSTTVYFIKSGTTRNDFLNNMISGLKKDCYVFNNMQDEIRFVGLFEQSIDDPLKYNFIARKVDLSKFAKQKEHRNKRLAKKIPMDVLKRKAVEHDHALAKKEDKEGIITIRDPYVAEYTKRRAHGRCQLCGAEAPFIDNNGDPYLESHHVVWLSQGGEDSIHNTVALCPNCHRRVHILKNAEDIEKLKKILAQD